MLMRQLILIFSYSSMPALAH